MASIDLDDLAEELSGALGRVNCWAYTKVAGADELRDKHLRTLQEDGGAGPWAVCRLPLVQRSFISLITHVLSGCVQQRGVHYSNSMASL